MMAFVRTTLLLAATAIFAAACGQSQDQAAAPPAEDLTGPVVETAAAPEPTTAAPRSYGAVTEARFNSAEDEPGQWMGVGRTRSEQRYSPLDQINRDTVSELGLLWSADLDTDRGQEATPVFIDGVLYITTAWSMVKAYDAASGELLWDFDPQVPREWGVRACCDVVNRGVAVHEGKVYVGTIYGELIALDAANGEVLWRINTVDEDHRLSYTITGAPRVVKGNVIIGNGGAEYGVRGYVTAYDAETGEQAWRFYTVPGNPADGFEDEAMEMAADTWNGEWWFIGGGGTVWDAIVYDPETDLVYLGVGNGSPWNRALRSPGGGDNLFLTSIVAIDPNDGSYVWHYQTTNGESWDHTATQPIMTADLEIGGETRHVVMQAPKNGFFYVLDAATGELISAEAIAEITWATHVDMETGRPVETPEARYEETGEAVFLKPGPLGVHNWHPMAYSRDTGYVYIPVRDGGSAYAHPDEFEVQEVGSNVGLDRAAGQEVYEAMGGRPQTKFRLIAWDPVAQEEVWHTPDHDSIVGGALATGGGLVFSGNVDGEFVAYNDETGDREWETRVQTGVVAAPSTFLIDGEQHIALLVGSRGFEPHEDEGQTNLDSANNSRLLVFKLGGEASLPGDVLVAARELDPPALTASAETVAHGATVFDANCSLCHGAGAAGGTVAGPDLRYSPLLHDETGWGQVVVGGVLAGNGMASFDPVLEDGDAEAILAYVIAQANAAKEEEAAGD
ncbi:MAG: PQQ-dependent dehydrogenase, methanol/ethanol family [Maricaulaceae bacterium]|jgi:PQQ-dependent dehydrogenase (methanol/ethanol family)